MSSWRIATRPLSSICTRVLKYLKRGQACGLTSYRVVITWHAFSNDIIDNNREALQENAWLGDLWLCGAALLTLFSIARCLGM